MLRQLRLQVHQQTLTQTLRQTLIRMPKQMLPQTQTIKATSAQNKIQTHSQHSLNQSKTKILNNPKIKIHNPTLQDLQTSSLTYLQKLRKDNFNETFIFPPRLGSRSRRLYGVPQKHDVYEKSSRQHCELPNRLGHPLPPLRSQNC